MPLTDDREAQLSREISHILLNYFEPGYDVTVIVREHSKSDGLTLVGKPRAVTFLTSESDLRPLAHILKSAIQRRLTL